MVSSTHNPSVSQERVKSCSDYSLCVPDSGLLSCPQTVSRICTIAGVGFHVYPDLKPPKSSPRLCAYSSPGVVAGLSRTSSLGVSVVLMRCEYPMVVFLFAVHSLLRSLEPGSAASPTLTRTLTLPFHPSLCVSNRPPGSVSKCSRAAPLGSVATSLESGSWKLYMHIIRELTRRCFMHTSASITYVYVSRHSIAPEKVIFDNRSSFHRFLFHGNNGCIFWQKLEEDTW